MNRHVVVRTIDRADPSVVDALGEIGTATVHEAIGRVGYVGPHIRPIQSDTKIAGSAVTVLGGGRTGEDHAPFDWRSNPDFWKEML